MYQTFRVRDVTVHRIVELTAPFDPALDMLAGLTLETLDAHRPHLQPGSLDSEDRFVLSYQCYLVETPRELILIDSCIGNGKHRPRPEWHMKSDSTFLDTLDHAGFGVNDIDWVVPTHLHHDHVGWNTCAAPDGGWVPTFPQARYVFGATELAATEHIHRHEKVLPAYLDSVVPIVKADQAEIVDGNFRIGDHVRLLPTPGHTDGHVAVRVGDGSDNFVMSGDLLHTELQIRNPALSFARDRDPRRSAETRRAFLERYSDTDTLLCTGHLPSRSVGRVVREGNGFAFVPVDAEPAPRDRLDRSPAPGTVR
ncbi:MBL fold metallo-hydrolase [Streptomyces sp. NPDC059255]|uniref:MBL fold metallo-hydrolase n=1 Tax=Streptomyces sp. NPDC059255 TaxID=3346793 RepID=UPI0036C1AB2F